MFDKLVLRGFNIDTIIIQNKKVNEEKLNKWLSDNDHIEYIKYVSYAIGNPIHKEIRLNFKYMIIAILKKDTFIMNMFNKKEISKYKNYLEYHSDYDYIIGQLKNFEDMEIDKFDMSEFKLFEEYLFDEIIENQMIEDYYILYFILLLALILTYCYSHILFGVVDKVD